jgi:hypothetical protein
MAVQQLRDEIHRLVPSRRPSDVAVWLGISQSYASRLLAGEVRVTDRLLRRLRDRTPELRPLCDVLLLEGGDHYLVERSSQNRDESINAIAAASGN